MHLFPTTLASFECSSINSESQSRPLAVKSVVDTKHKHLRKYEAKRTEGERHEQEGSNRRRKAFMIGPRISFLE